MFNLEIEKGCEQTAKVARDCIHAHLDARGLRFNAHTRGVHIHHADWLAETLGFVKPACYVENLYIKHLLEHNLQPLTFELVTLGVELLKAPCLTILIAKEWQIDDSRLHFDIVVDGEGDIEAQMYHVCNMHHLLLHRMAFERQFRCLPTVQAANTLWLP